MKGGIIQLLSNKGVSDKYISGDANITFFKNIYRRHTNFSKGDIFLKPKSKLDFGKKAIFKIDRLGDLINSLILKIELPEIEIKYRNISYTELNVYLQEVNIMDLYEDSNKYVTDIDINDTINILINEVNYLLDLNLVYETIINEINILKNKYFENDKNRDTSDYDNYLLNYLVDKYDTNNIQLKFINAMIIDSNNKENEKNDLLNMNVFLKQLTKNYKEQMIGDSLDGEQLIINLISTIKYNNLYNFNNNFNLDAKQFFYNNTKKEYNLYNQKTNFDETELSFYFNNFFLLNNRKILKSFDINILKDKLISELFWNYYDTSNIYLNIYASLKEEYKFIFYKNDLNIIKNMSLLETNIDDKFINTKKILPYDLKIDYFKNKLITGLKIFFPTAKSLDINVDINTVNLYYRDYVDKKINSYHHKNIKILKHNMIKEYLESDILINNLSIKVSNYLPFINNEESIQLRNKLNNCYLLNLIYLSLPNNLKNTILNFTENIYINHEDLYDNLTHYFEESITSINNQFYLSNDSQYNIILSKSDVNYLEQLYDNMKEKGEDMESSNKIITYIFKKENKVMYNGTVYSILDYIFIIFQDAIKQSLEDYRFSGEFIDEILFNKQIDQIFNLYKKNIDHLPNNSIYISNNHNLSNYYQMNLLNNSYNNYYDIYTCIINHINSQFKDNYNNFYYKEILDDKLLINLRLKKKNTEINNSFLEQYIEKNTNDDIIKINYYDIKLTILNQFIKTDQIIFPMQNIEGTIDNFWIQRNEVFLLLNILHLNLLKIEDLNFSKKDYEFLGFNDLYDSVMRRLIVDNNTYILFKDYINGNYNDPPFNGGIYDKNVVTRWFKTDYAHYLNDNYLTLTGNNPEFHKLSREKFKIISNNLSEYYREGVMDVINRLIYDFDILITSSINKDSNQDFYNKLKFNDINNYDNDKLKELTKLFDLLKSKTSEELLREKDKFINIMNFNTLNLYNDIDIITSKYNYFNNSIDIYNFIKDKLISKSFLLSLDNKKYFDLKSRDPDYINNYLINNYYKKIRISNDIINKIQGNDGNGGLKEQLQKIIGNKKNANFSWVESIGHHIIKSVSLYLNDQLIDKITGEWIHLHSILFGSKKKKGKTYARMIGHMPHLISYNNLKKPSTTLYIPLPFWFFKFPNQSIPLVALQYSELNVEIELRELNECCNYEFLTEFNRKPKLKCELLVGYLYLDEKERSLIANGKNEYLIEQLQYKNSIIITKNDIIKDNIIELDFTFNNCVKYLVWTFQPISYRTSNYELKKLNNYLLSEEEINNNFNLIDTNNINLLNVKKYSEEYNEMLLSKSEEYKEYHFFEELKILFDGITREEYKKNNYYNYVQPSTYFKSSSIDGLYMYSFCLNPKTYQPSGAANLGLVDKVSFNMKITNKAIELLNNNNNIRFSIYAVTYNNLRITSGLGGLSFYK